MKNLIMSMLLSIGLVSCSSCTPVPPPVDPIVPSATVSVTASATATPTVPVPTDTVVAKDNWEFTLPGVDWLPLQTDCDLDSCIVGMINKDRTSIVVFHSENFEGSFDEYVIEVARSIKAEEATIVLSATTQLGGNDFVLIESTRDDLTVWMWVTVIDNKGYGLSCGGSGDNKTLCLDVANTLKLN